MPGTVTGDHGEENEGGAWCFGHGVNSWCVEPARPSASPARALPWPPVSADRITAALVGIGERGARHLAAALLPDVALAMICDRNPRALSGAMDRLASWRTPPPSSVDDYRRILDAQVDLVVIAVPVAQRASLVADAVSAGKHVYVEPPWAATSEESAHLRDLAERTDRVIWQGQSELSWDNRLLTLTDDTAASTKRTLEIVAACPSVPGGTVGGIGAGDLVQWLDPLSYVASRFATVPDSTSALRAGAPDGEHVLFDFTLPSGSALKRVRASQRPLPRLRSQELRAAWSISLGDGHVERSVEILVHEHAATAPDPERDLVAWQPLLTSIRAANGRVTASHQRAHQAFLWMPIWPAPCAASESELLAWHALHGPAADGALQDHLHVHV